MPPLNASALVNLATLAGGSVAERFQFALAEVIENVLDPNTPADKKRTIVLTLDITPDAKRESADVDVEVVVKPAKSHKNSTRIYFGTRDGQNVAVEHNPKQSRMFDEKPSEPANSESTGNVVHGFPRG